MLPSAGLRLTKAGETFGQLGRSFPAIHIQNMFLFFLHLTTAHNDRGQLVTLHSVTVTQHGLCSAN